MNFKQATTHVLILSVIQRGALQTHCLQHWDYILCFDAISNNATFYFQFGNGKQGKGSILGKMDTDMRRLRNSFLFSNLFFEPR